MKFVWIFLLSFLAAAQQQNSLFSPLYGEVCDYEGGVILLGQRPSGDEFHIPDFTTFDRSAWVVAPGTTLTFILDETIQTAGELHIANLTSQRGYALYEDVATGESPFTYTFETGGEDNLYIFYIENDWTDQRNAIIEMQVFCGAELPEAIEPVRLEGWNTHLFNEPRILVLRENTPSPLPVYRTPDLSSTVEAYLGRGSQVALLSDLIVNSDGLFYEIRLANGQTGFITDSEVDSYVESWDNTVAVPSGFTCPAGDLPALLQIGEQGYPSYGWGNSTLRATPGGDPIMDIPEGELFTVISGPACTSNGTMWFEVEYEGNYGWISQGNDDNGYWISRADG